MFTRPLFRQVRGLLLGVVALALALGAAGPAFAQDEPPAGPAAGGARWGRGTVTAVGPDTFTVRTHAGRDRTLTVNAATTFFDAAGRPAALADLTVGARVAGASEVQADGTAIAVLVIIFPPQTRYAGIGVVTAREPDAFHFVNRRGHVWEFYVDDATAYTNRAGDSLTFADLQVETRVFVEAELRADGQWWAVAVKLGR